MCTHYFSNLVACSQNALSCSIQAVHLFIRLRSTITYIRFGWSKRDGPLSNACCNNNIRIPLRAFNASHHWRTADYRSCELDIRSECCALTLWLIIFQFILKTWNCICGHFNGFSMSFLYTDNVPNNYFLELLCIPWWFSRVCLSLCRVESRWNSISLGRVTLMIATLSRIHAWAQKTEAFRGGPGACSTKEKFLKHMHFEIIISFI